MVSAKDLRDVFEDIRSEAGKRAAEFVSDAKVPEIRRHDEPPGIVWLGIGLVLGAVVGMAIALIAAPSSGERPLATAAPRTRRRRPRTSAPLSSSLRLGRPFSNPAWRASASLSRAR
jgi:hypothetical protein